MTCTNNYIGNLDENCVDKRRNGKGSFTCYCKQSLCNTLEFLEKEAQKSIGRPDEDNLACYVGTMDDKIQDCNSTSKSCMMSVQFRDEKLMSPKTYGCIVLNFER